MKKNLHIKFTAFALCLSLMLPGPLGAYASNVPATEAGSTQATEQTPEAASAAVPVTEDTTTPATEAMSEESKDTQAEQTETETESRETQAPQETESQETESQESQSQETQAPEDESTETESQESETLNLDEAADPAAEEDLTTQFVRRLYNVILLREPDPKGLEEWVQQLKTGTETGAEVTRGFVFSKEFIEKNYSNEEYIERLYNAILGRNSDPDGMAGWVSELETGFSRLHICSGFVGSVEFTELCEQYGITRGSIASSDIIDQNENLTRFVSRLYTLILQRKPDRTGLSEWVSQLYKHNNTAAEVISGFTDSVEFKERNFTDEEYISILYQTIFNRTPDNEGMNTWKGNLDVGMSRTFVLYHLVYSKEFTELCQKYNVVKGEIKLTESRDMNKDLTVFVNTAYENCLKRKGNASDLNTWTKNLSNGSSKPSDFLKALIFSNESNSSQMNVENFIRLAFLTVFQRTPSESEVTNWTYNLSDSSNNRELCLTNMMQTDEFRNLIGKIGLSEGRRFQNPAGYYQVQDAIAPLSGGGYELNMGYMGLKVYKVQKKLGISNHRAIVDMTFINTVKKFQEKKGLKVDGIVGLNTWRALGFSDNDWYNIGTYISPLKVNENSSKSDHIEASINTAYTYLGTEYVIGASGSPGTGIDCSGLVMQALYSAGLDLSPINPVRHSRAGYEYESQSMFDSKQFKHVNYNDRQRGDLIFYQGSYGNIIHVAIYLGNNQVIEAWPPQVVVWPITNAQRANIAGVVRPFI